MAIASSGAVNFDDLRNEFNATGSVSFSDFYRGAATNYVRANAANNTATNLAASVPTSGAINFTNFRGAARGFRKTYASNATNQNASSVFGTDWGVDYPKDIVINSGVTLGATSTSDEALEINTGGLGTITITNNGTIVGAGGSANGGAGGDAFEAAVSCTFVNNGYVYAGGGGGGQGGAGGQGSYTTSSYTRQPSSGYYKTDYYIWAGGCGIIWGSTVGYVNSSDTVKSLGGWTYYRGSSTKYLNGGPCNDQVGRELYRAQSSSSTSYTSGGSGGSGGAGAGYNQSAAAGASGSSGGTNAGSGGSGGTGGGYGANGSSGNSGANGNYTNGSGGSGGGAAGKYIRGYSNVTFTNNGTVAGGTA